MLCTLNVLFTCLFYRISSKIAASIADHSESKYIQVKKQERSYKSKEKKMSKLNFCKLLKVIWNLHNFFFFFKVQECIKMNFRRIGNVGTFMNAISIIVDLLLDTFF